MNIKYTQAQAKHFQDSDNRLSFDVCLAEAILQQVIIELDTKGAIPQARVIDKSKR